MRNLLAYVITGTTFNWDTYEYDTYENIVGIDIQVWNDDNINGDPFKLILTSETYLTNYSNITTITNLDTFGYMCTDDYCIIKYEIKYIYEISGWTNLSNYEKDICIKYSVCSGDEGIAYLTGVSGFTTYEAKTYIENMWGKQNVKVINSNYNRWNYIKLCFVKYLGKINSDKVVDNLDYIIISYLNIGRIGINYGDSVDGIMDYIESTNGFLGGGLVMCGYDTIYGTYADFIYELKNIIIYGIY